METNNHNIQIFLNRLKWKIHSGDLTQLDEFQIDVYLFRFKTPLIGNTLKEFVEFIQELPMKELRSVMIMFVWLYQHDVKFCMVFGYNFRLAFLYNIKNIFEPRRISKLLLSCGHDDLMSCPIRLIMQKN